MFERPLDVERMFGQHVRMRRTYVRRRVVAVLLLIAVMSLPAAAAAVLPRGDARPGTPRTYVVRPGDTLWDIAERAAPGRDPRQTIADLTAVNGVDAGSLVPGQQLRLPSG
jgi:Tfp pilus assembly protein FimV